MIGMITQGMTYKTNIELFLFFGTCYLSIMFIGMMNDSYSQRQAPYWNPDDPNGISFRAWITDLIHWSLMTDMAPHAQAASIASRLGGTARELVRTLDPDEMFNGGIINGVHYDPVTYIVTGLNQHYAPLEEEVRMGAMTEFLAFSRRQGESMNSALARYDMVRNRARVEGNFNMNVEVCALQLMKALGTSTHEMVELCRPFGGVYPSTEAEFTQLKQTIRRRAHITEHTPNNIGQFLHGNRQASPNAYFTQNDPTSQHAYHTVPSVEPTTFLDMFGGGSSSSGSAPAAAPPNFIAPQSSVTSGSEAEPEWDSGTDTDTSSDSGQHELDYSDLSQMTPQEAEEELFYQQRYAKRRFRRYMGKPVRRVRRFIKKRAYFFRKGKGKSNGKGKHRKGSRTLFYAEPEEAAEALAYLNGNHMGRSKNPVGKDGEIMKCFLCGADDHLKDKCPNAPTTHHYGKHGGRKGKGKQRNYYGQPLLDWLNHSHHQTEQHQASATAETPAASSQPSPYDPSTAAPPAWLSQPALETIGEQPDEGPLAALMGSIGAMQSSIDLEGPSSLVVFGHPSAKDAPAASSDAPAPKADPWTNDNDPWSGKSPPKAKAPEELSGPDPWLTMNFPAAAKSRAADMMSRAALALSALTPRTRRAFLSEHSRNTELLLGEGSTQEAPSHLLGAPVDLPKSGSPVTFGPAASFPSGVNAVPLPTATGAPVSPRTDAMNQVRTIALQFEEAQQRLRTANTEYAAKFGKVPPPKSPAEPGAAFTPVYPGGQPAAWVNPEPRGPPPRAEATFSNPEVVANLMAFAENRDRATADGISNRWTRDAPLAMGKAAAARDQAEASTEVSMPKDHTNEQSWPRMRGRNQANVVRQRAVAKNLTELLHQPRLPPEQSPQPKMGAGFPGLMDNPIGSFVPRRMPSSFSQNTEGIPDDSLSITSNQVRYLNALNVAKANNEESRRTHLTRNLNIVTNRLTSEELAAIPHKAPPPYEPIRFVPGETLPGFTSMPNRPAATVTRLNRDGAIDLDDELNGASSEDDTSNTPSLVQALVESIGVAATAARDAGAFGPKPPPPVRLYSTVIDSLESHQAGIIARLEVLEAAQRPSDLQGEVAVYNGDIDECSICLAAFTPDQRVMRLQCFHVFHASCWVQGSRTLESCPNCRAPARVIATWSWVQRGTLTQQTCIVCGSEAPNFQEVERAPQPEASGASSSSPGTARTAPVETLTTRISVAVSQRSASSTPRSIANVIDERDEYIAPRATLEDWYATSQEALNEDSPRDLQASQVNFPPGEQRPALPAPISTPVPEADVEEDSTYIVYPETHADAQAWRATSAGTILDRGERTWQPQPSSSSSTAAYHTETRLANGSLGLLVDPGSVCNLAGGDWTVDVAKASIRNGRKPDQKVRDRPLRVSGVGSGSQQATHNVVLPIALAQTNGEVTSGTFETPSVTGSSLPGLLGLSSMRDRRAILDMVTNRLYFLGQGDYDLHSVLPTGTEEYQLETAPSGHLLLPIDHYAEFDQRQMRGSLQLDQQPVSLLTQTNA